MFILTVSNFHEPPPISNVPTRDRRITKNIPLPKVQQLKQLAPEYDHDQCTWHYPYHSVPSGTTSRGIAFTTPSAAFTSVTTPAGSPKSVPASLFCHSGITAPSSHGSPGTPKTTTLFSSSTPIPEPPTSFVESPAHSRNRPRSPSTPSSVRSKPWFRGVIDNATGALQFGEATVASPAAPQCNLLSSTIEQRKAQPLRKAKLPPDLSEIDSPANSEKTLKSPPTS